jgi:hypothetical protein
MTKMFYEQLAIIIYKDIKDKLEKKDLAIKSKVTTQVIIISLGGTCK